MPSKALTLKIKVFHFSPKHWCNKFSLLTHSLVVPELREIIGDEAVNQLAEEKDKESLRKVYTKLMETSEDVIKAQSEKLLNRAKIMGTRYKTSLF